MKREGASKLSCHIYGAAVLLEPDQKATPRDRLTQLLELLRELLLRTRTNSRAMGLDQVLLKKIPTKYSDNNDEYVQILRKRKCYPLHEFIG